VQFVYSAHAKPSLPGGQLAFNLSHSQQVALFAFCRETAVGVDVEQIRPMPDGEEIAARFFSADDNARFLAVPPAQRDLAFFNCWTRKEAFIKAIGEGLSHPLDLFDVTLQPGEPARILRLHGRAELAARWSLTHLEPAPGFVGALALEAPPRQVVTYRWE
jgi:4'-phosphopantetheinyl transferase